MTQVRTTTLFAVVDETGATAPLYLGGDNDGLSVFLTRERAEYFKNEYQQLFPEKEFVIQEFGVLPDEE